jgi:ATP-dependent protease Clp ATPase subunit
MLRTRMGCSFCGRRAADVAKLVAGPTRLLGRVYICDRCAAQTIHIMDQHSDSGRPPEEKPSLLHQMLTRIVGVRRRDDFPKHSECHAVCP